MTDVPALGMSYQFQISERRSIVFQTHIAADIDDATLDEMLDQMARAANRQQAMLELIDNERHLAAEEAQLKFYQRDLVEYRAEIEEHIRQDGRRNPRMTQQEKAALKVKEVSVEKTASMIEERRGLVKALAHIAGKSPVANGAAEA